jgi:hypothetical protein
MRDWPGVSPGFAEFDYLPGSPKRIASAFSAARAALIVE